MFLICPTFLLFSVFLSDTSLNNFLRKRLQSRFPENLELIDGLDVHRIVVSNGFAPFTLKALNSCSLESTADGKSKGSLTLIVVYMT